MNMILNGPEARARRARLGLTLRDVADRIGVSVTALHYWEKGVRDVTPERQAQLIEVLGPRRGLFRAVGSPR